MRQNKLWLVLVGGVLGFIGGFILSNTLNRNELLRIRGELNALRTEQTANQAAGNESPKLSINEIRAAIERADQNPRNTELQQNLGFALYRYANTERETVFLPDVARLLRRASDNAVNDGGKPSFDLTVSLANVLFDLGQLGEPNRFVEARLYYRSALKERPDDADVRTDLGLTYFLAEPSEPDAAITEYRRALRASPKHEKAQQNLIAALSSKGELEEARRRLEELRRDHPQNPVLSDLETQIAQREEGNEEMRK